MNKILLFQFFVLSFLISACLHSISERSLNESNIDRVKNITTFGTPSESCANYSSLDPVLGTRVVNSQVEYLLAIKDRESRNIQVWNFGSEKVIQTFDDRDADTALFAPDQQTLITFSRYESGTLTLWNLQTGNQRQEFHFESNHWYDERISISQDGLRIAFFSCSPNAVDCHVSEFDLQTNKINSTDYIFPLYSDIPIPPHTYTPSGNLVAITYNSDNKLHLLDLTNHKDTILEIPFSTLDDVWLAKAKFEALAISSNQRYVVGGALNGDIYLWNFADGALLTIFEAHTTQQSDGWVGAIKSLEFSPESNLLLSVGYDGFTKLWDVNTRVLVKEIDTCHRFGGFTQDGRYLVTVGKKGIELWGIP